jgi:hypothetical protein
MKVLNIVILLTFVSFVSCTKNEEATLPKSEIASVGKPISELKQSHKFLQAQVQLMVQILTLVAAAAEEAVMKQIGPRLHLKRI